jgi:hypothetical protein
MTKNITVHKQDGSTYSITIPEFHKEPYNEVSLACEDPEALINALIQKYEVIKVGLLEDVKFFPGDTNFIGHSIYDTIESVDSLLYCLKMTGHGPL